MNITIIGSGNVATHLAAALSPHAEVTMMNPHHVTAPAQDTDLTLICVKDDAICEIAARLEGSNGVVAHTSGSVPASVLSETSSSFGVLYPMQTFTKGVAMDYSEIPFFIEGNTPDAEMTLHKVASMISTHVDHADSEQRRRLHLASVFACNFTNAMVGIADDILGEVGLDYTSLLPLLRQTVAKLTSTPPAEAQTGPAVRGDEAVMSRHLDMLKGNPGYQSVYHTLSSIIKRQHKRN